MRRRNRELNMSSSPIKSVSPTNRARLRRVFICVLLAGITIVAFLPVGRLGFTIYDDQEYVVKNPHIQAGINASTIGWAFTTTHTGNWHPVTWLSHMLDGQLFELKAGGHHWMNLGFHTANVVLLFLILSRMMRHRREASAPQVSEPLASQTGSAPETSGIHFGADWCCALVAALFAMHPLRIESVSWISERKDVLSGFFMMLTLWAYTRYVENSKVQSPRPKVFYWL